MKFNKNDPRLTAYVLNEVSNEDRLLIEQAVKTDPEIKAEIELLNKAVAAFHESSHEPIYRLNQSQREKIFKRKPTRNTWWVAAGSFATAGLALMLVLKNPATTDSQALFEQEKFAKKIARSEFAPTAAPQASEPEDKDLSGVSGASEQTKDLGKSHVEEEVVVPTPALSQAPTDTTTHTTKYISTRTEAIATAPVETEKFAAAPAPMEAESALGGLRAKTVQADSTAMMADASGSTPTSRASGVAVNQVSGASGAGRSQPMAAAKVAAPKKTEPLHFVFLFSNLKQLDALETEIQQTVLPELQSCLGPNIVSMATTGMTVTINLSLQQKKVTQLLIVLSGAEVKALALLEECIKTKHPKTLQNSGSLQEYSYRLKVAPK